MKILEGDICGSFTTTAVDWYSRTTAWAGVRAAEYHRPSALIVENVPEFADWTLYPAWCAALNALGYALSPMVRDAADHGVPQNRLRLFIIGTRSRHPVQIDLPSRPHRPVASIVNLHSGSWSLILGDRMRMLTTNEYRAAMGFPDGHELPPTRREAIHMLGNAVCPPVAADLVSALRMAA